MLIGCIMISTSTTCITVVDVQVRRVSVHTFWESMREVCKKRSEGSINPDKLESEEEGHKPGASQERAQQRPKNQPALFLHLLMSVSQDISQIV